MSLTGKKNYLVIIFLKEINKFYSYSDLLTKLLRTLVAWVLRRRQPISNTSWPALQVNCQKQTCFPAKVMEPGTQNFIYTKPKPSSGYSDNESLHRLYILFSYAFPMKHWDQNPTGNRTEYREQKRPYCPGKLQECGVKTIQKHLCSGLSANIQELCLTLDGGAGIHVCKHHVNTQSTIKVWSNCPPKLQKSSNLCQP